MKTGFFSLLLCVVLGACSNTGAPSNGLEASFEGALPIDGFLTFKR